MAGDWSDHYMVDIFNELITWSVVRLIQQMSFDQQKLSTSSPSLWRTERTTPITSAEYALEKWHYVRSWARQQTVRTPAFLATTIVFISDSLTSQMSHSEWEKRIEGIQLGNCKAHSCSIQIGNNDEKMKGSTFFLSRPVARPSPSYAAANGVSFQMDASNQFSNFRNSADFSLNEERKELLFIFLNAWFFLWCL